MQDPIKIMKAKIGLGLWLKWYSAWVRSVRIWVQTTVLQEKKIYFVGVFCVDWIWVFCQICELWLFSPILWLLTHALFRWAFNFNDVQFITSLNGLCFLCPVQEICACFRVANVFCVFLSNFMGRKSVPLQLYPRNASSALSHVTQ